MKALGSLSALLFAGLMAASSVLMAKDVHVKGYTRKDGTYVQPHIRSSPDAYKWNNYGPSRNPSELMAPQTWDADRDGTPNYLDRDDNNNQLLDDNDPRQYSR